MKVKTSKVMWDCLDIATQQKLLEDSLPRKEARKIRILEAQQEALLIAMPKE